MRLVPTVPITERWPSVASKWLFALQQRDPRDSDGVVTAFRDGEVTLRTNRRVEGFTNAVVEVGYQGVRRGDLVVHSMDAFAGAVGVSDSDGKASPVVHAYCPAPGVDPRFYAYLLRDLARGGFVATLAKGIRERSTSFDSWTFRSLVLPRPSLDEQSRISDFLDAETAHIDALIAKKRQLTILFDERLETAIHAGISGLLTRPSEQRACTERAWVSTLPVDWRMAAIGAHFEVQLGKMLSPDVVAQESDEGAVPYLRNQDVQWDRVVTEGLPRMRLNAAERWKYSLRRGDLLVCEGGEVGRSAIWNGAEELSFQKAVHRLRPLRAANARFLMYCLRAASWRGLFVAEGNHSTIAHLTAEQLRTHRMPFPDPVEQATIVEVLDKEAARTAMVREKADRQIELLHEHRQALITAAVTGQIAIP